MWSSASQPEQPPEAQAHRLLRAARNVQSQAYPNLRSQNLHLNKIPQVIHMHVDKFKKHCSRPVLNSGYTRELPGLMCKWE